MIDDEKRLRKRNIVNWDFFVEANNPRALPLIPTIMKAMDVPMVSTVGKGQSKDRDECKECKYKQAVEEILNILAVCKIVKKSEERESDKENRGHKIEV